MRTPPGVDVGADPRLPEIDRLRGLVMVLMALDHMRDFFDADAIRFSPTDLDRTYPFLFFTRFITHFCAPTFALLAGVGAYLYGARGRSAKALSLFLATRGLWLILLDIVVISPVWEGPGHVELGTLWAIGCGLLALSFLSLLPARVVLAIGAAVILGHNLLDGVHAADLGAFGPYWRLIHEKGPLPFGVAGTVHYPALAWIGVVALGYGIGPIFQTRPADRNRVLRRAGIGALALFALLRAGNLYGDPHPWAMQREAVFAVLSFFNLTKYPPSLLYLLVTLGVFGRTPLLFYVLHLYLGVAGALALAYGKGYTLDDIGAFVKSGVVPAEFGIGLAGAYAAWLLVTLALYPLCRWFGSIKQRRSDLWWLSYL